MLDRTDQIQGVQFGMIFIGGRFVLHPQNDQDAAGHTQSQSDNVDKRVSFVSLDVPESDPKVVFNHGNPSLCIFIN